MSQAPKTTRIEARISPQALATVRRAAELQGRSLSDFVVIAAEETARRVIEDGRIVTLAVEHQRRFAELLIDPPPLSPGLKRAQDAHRRLIEDGANGSVPD